MKTQIKNVVMGVAVAAAMLVGVAQGAEAPTKTVRYQDLNLNTEAGVQVLYKRIQALPRWYAETMMSATWLLRGLTRLVLIGR
jgi:hypothetical protein